MAWLAGLPDNDSLQTLSVVVTPPGGAPAMEAGAPEALWVSHAILMGGECPPTPARFYGGADFEVKVFLSHPGSQYFFLEQCCGGGT